MTTPPPDELRAAIEAHWSPRGDLERIRAELARKKRQPPDLRLEDLAAHDQLHAGGLPATREFAAWVEVPPAARVLDLGAGLGGSARLLAQEHDARVLAVDLSAELTATGAALTRWMGLTDQVEHQTGAIESLDACGPFDLLWLQNVDMHVPDKGRLYERCRGLLGDHGRVVWHDWLAGPTGPPRWPVPWSKDGSLSFLAKEADLRQHLKDTGLEVTRLEDLTARTDAWYTELERNLQRALDRFAEKGRSAPPHLERLLVEVRTLLTNLAEHRVIAFFGEARPTASSPRSY